MFEVVRVIILLAPVVPNVSETAVCRPVQSGGALSTSRSLALLVLFTRCNFSPTPSTIPIWNFARVRIERVRLSVVGNRAAVLSLEHRSSHAGAEHRDSEQNAGYSHRCDDHDSCAE